MHNVGILLKSKREALGYNLAFVASILKIRERYLDGIEKWDFANLPHQVYIIGYIKSYANFIGLDGAQISKKFREMYGKETKLDIPEVILENSSPNLVVIILSLVTSIAIFNLWTSSRIPTTDAEKINQVIISQNQND